MKNYQANKDKSKRTACGLVGANHGFIMPLIIRVAHDVAIQPKPIIFVVILNLYKSNTMYQSKPTRAF